MTQTKHKVISVNYNLHRDNEQGDMIESTIGKAPLTFLSGSDGGFPES